MGIWWLLNEKRRGKPASSVVIYVKSGSIGRKHFHTTKYEWDRPSARPYQGATPPSQASVCSDDSNEDRRYEGEDKECIICSGPEKVPLSTWERVISSPSRSLKEFLCSSSYAPPLDDVV